jgi:hypothetical protein
VPCACSNSSVLGIPDVNTTLSIALAFNVVGHRAVLILLGQEEHTMTMNHLFESIRDNPSPRMQMIL